jgi:uncharacterized protein (DUF2249 family)
MTDGDATTWTEAGERHVDVRGLPPPQPLVRILAMVGRTDDTTPIVVHHDRDPRLLYAELAEFGWQAERIDGAPGEVRLRLTPVR